MENKKRNSKIRQFILDLKSYLSIESDYYQVLLVEKTTKIVSLIILFFLLSGLFLGLFFFLLLGLAYFLSSIYGKLITFWIVLGLIILFMLLVILFRKKIITNPILRLVLNIFDDKTFKGRKEDKDENN